MFAVILETVTQDEPSVEQVHYFVSIRKAKDFAANIAKHYTHTSIFEEIGFVHDGEVIMSNKFERNNQTNKGRQQCRNLSLKSTPARSVAGTT